MSKWFKKYRYSRSPDIRVFCFPYAGGSAALFDGWEAHFPEQVDLFALQAPGRGDRFSEPPIPSLNRKVDEIRREIVPYLNVPHIFVGHSNGALTAFELAKDLQKRGNRYLEHLVISAKRAPHLPTEKKAIHTLPDDEFIEELKTFSAIPDELTENREIMMLLLPMLRADFSLSEDYTVDPKAKLFVDTTLFWGAKDTDIAQDDMQNWSQYIFGDVNLVTFPGDHFFIHSDQQLFIDALNRLISNVLKQHDEVLV